MLIIEHLILLFVVVYFLYELWRLYLGWSSSSWAFTRGMVTMAQIRSSYSHRNRREKAHPKVRYEYVVGGEKYEGKNLSFQPRLLNSYSSAIDDLSGIYSGKEVRVYYDRSHPKRSVLVRGVGIGNFLTLIGIAIGIVFFVARGL